MALEKIDLFDDFEEEPTEEFPQISSELDNTSSIETLDSQTELIHQFNRAKRLQTDTINNNTISPEKRAAVIRTVTVILSHIVRSQTELYNAERLKRLERALITVVKTLPKEAQEAFFNEYERELAREG